jgi:hypothetical protein
MWIQGQVLVFALPLWIVGHTHAPRWLVGASVLVNTGMVVALQVRASRGIGRGLGGIVAPAVLGLLCITWGARVVADGRGVRCGWTGDAVRRPVG